MSQSSRALSRATKSTTALNRGSRRASTIAATSLAAVLGVTTLSPAPAQATLSGSNQRVYFGAAGQVTELNRRTAGSMGAHAYSRLNTRRIPRARMITINDSARWSQVANARAGSAIHANIVRWANALKHRGVVMVAFQHEPEAGTRSKGTPAQYQAAHRRVVTIMRNKGATNVKFMVQMTAWSFKTKKSDRRHISKWYPGDRYVDVVGADAYNWNTCGEGRGRWKQLSDIAGPALRFAKNHNKQFALPEFASHRGSRRAAWVRNAKAWMVNNKSSFAGAYYFNRPPTNASNSNCRWTLTTSGEYSAISSITTATRHFGA